MASYCNRCSASFSAHVLSGWNCVGCNRPPVLFTMTIIEQKPYDMPVTKLLEGMDENDRASAIPVLDFMPTKIEGV